MFSVEYGRLSLPLGGGGGGESAYRKWCTCTELGVDQGCGRFFLKNIYDCIEGPCEKCF